MPNKNYLRGRRLEWQVKKDLEQDGWTVMRTAGSHGFADLIALKGDTIRFIQCKTIATAKGSGARIKSLKREVASETPQDGLAQVKHELIVKVKGIGTYETYPIGA